MYILSWWPVCPQSFWPKKLWSRVCIMAHGWPQHICSFTCQFYLHSRPPYCMHTLYINIYIIHKSIYKCVFVVLMLDLCCLIEYHDAGLLFQADDIVLPCLIMSIVCGAAPCHYRNSFCRIASQATCEDCILLLSTTCACFIFICSQVKAFGNHEGQLTTALM